MKIKNHLLGMMAIASLLVRRNSHPKFQTSVDVVEGCKKELVALKGKIKMSMDQFGSVVVVLLQLSHKIGRKK